MRFPVTYPDGQSKDQYIASIVSKYTEMNIDCSFSPEQIKIPIKKVIYSVTYVIENCSDPKYKLTKINLLRKFITDKSYFPKAFLESYLTYRSLYLFQKGSNIAPSVALENRGIPFPTEQEEAYVAFTQQMSREVIMGICDATEHLIYELQGRDKENISPTSESTSASSSKSKKSVRFFKEPTDVKSDDIDSVGIVNNFV